MLGFVGEELCEDFFHFLVPFALYLQLFGTRTCHFAMVFAKAFHFALFLLDFGMFTFHFAWHLLHFGMFTFYFVRYLLHFGTFYFARCVHPPFAPYLLHFGMFTVFVARDLLIFGT